MEESWWLQDFHRDVEWPFTLFIADLTSLTLLLESQGTVEYIKLLFPNNPIQSKDKRSIVCDRPLRRVCVAFRGPPRRRRTRQSIG